MSGASARARAVSALRRIGLVAELNERQDCSSTAAQVRATLANFLIALVNGQIEQDDAHGFFAAVEEQLERKLATHGRDGAPLEADDVQVALAEAFEQKRYLFRRQPAPTSYLDKPGLTLQPAAAFRFWLKDEIDLPYAWDRGQVLDAINHMNDSMKRRPGRTVGREGIVWLTPYYGEVRANVEPCYRSMANVVAWPATRLREVLGLIKRQPGEHCFVCVTRRALGVEQVAAPTILESMGYERFRHWPPQGMTDPEHVGRTYDLNRDKRRSAAPMSHGVPEVVRQPLSFEQVQRYIYVGEIEATKDTEFGVGGWTARIEAEREFADEVTGGRVASDIVALIEPAL